MGCHLEGSDLSWTETSVDPEDYFLQPQPFLFNDVQNQLQFSAVATGALNDTYAVDTSPARVSDCRAGRLDGTPRGMGPVGKCSVI